QFAAQARAYAPRSSLARCSLRRCQLLFAAEQSRRAQLDQSVQIRLAAFAAEQISRLQLMAYPFVTPNGRLRGEAAVATAPVSIIRLSRYPHAGHNVPLRLCLNLEQPPKQGRLRAAPPRRQLLEHGRNEVKRDPST